MLKRHLLLWEADGGGGGGGGAGAAPTIQATGGEAPAGGDAYSGPFASIADAELRQAIIGKGFQDENALAKSYVNLESMKGANTFKVPGADDPPEAWDAVYKAMGRPDDINGYEFEKPEIPNGMYYDDSMMEAMKPIFHEAGLSPAQANKLYEAYNKYQVGSYTTKYDQAAKEIDSKRVALTEQWGDKFDNNVAQIQAFVRNTADDEVKALFKQTGIDEHPVFHKWLHNLASNAGQDSALVRESSTGGGTIAQTKEQAQANINNMRNNADFMKRYYDGDKDAIATFNEAYKQRAKFDA